jgi:MOSC domain-containing protein YiiM
MAEVEAIFLVPSAGASPQPVDEVRAVAGLGLDGDRYFAGDGTFYAERKDGQDLTLIEAEAIEGLAREHGIQLGPGESRRNVVTRGIGLNELVGRRFRVGDVECEGRRLCDPCSHLEKLTEPGVLKGLVDRGGLRADIVRGGRIAVGDEVADLGAEHDARVAGLS